MTPEQLEERIRYCNTQVERLQQMRDATGNTNLALGYRIRQQRLAREVAALVAMRTPETVARIAGVSFLATVPAAFLQAQNETRR